MAPVNLEVNKFRGSGPIIGLKSKKLNSELDSWGIVFNDRGFQLLARLLKFRKTDLALRTKWSSSLVIPAGIILSQNIRRNRAVVRIMINWRRDFIFLRTPNLILLILKYKRKGKKDPSFGDGQKVSLWCFENDEKTLGFDKK